MDARGWEFSQSRRSSTKRPWDEGDTVLNSQPNLWNGLTLPPIDSTPYRRPSMTIEAATISSSGYTHEPTEAATKRPKYEGNDDRSPFRKDHGLNEEIRQARLHSPFPSHRGSLDASPFTQHHQREWERGGDAGVRPAPNGSSLCPRCRRLTTQPPASDLDLESNHEHDSGSIRNSEAALVAQQAADELTKVLNTLSSGISSVRHDIIRHPAEHQSEELPVIPPIAQQDLKQMLAWLLGRICVVNELAEKLVQHVQSPNSQLDHNSLQNGTEAQNDPHYSMKRHLDVDPNEGYRSMGDGVEPSDSKLFTRRKSVMTIPNPEDLPSIRSHHEYHPFHASIDGTSRRNSIMNPPPAPIRQLPPSPGHSLPSPTSASFPSPSAASYGSSSQSMNQPSHGLHAPSTPYLPSISSTHSSDSALQAHSAALQHEVSVQKIALSSLQSEHDKLLAAFTRSQTRASALERKHTVSDNEIVNLAEEKVRLQSQVADLEKDVEDLTRSRDEARQSAVKEGVQYVEIVKKASQLEEMAAEERKSWNTLKAEMEQRIELLSQRNMTEARPAEYSTSLFSPGMGTSDEMDVSSSSPSAIEKRPPDVVKPEPASPNQPWSVGLPSTSGHEDPTNDLKAEIKRLKTRCAEVEDTLRAVREESRSVEGIVRALGQAGKSILEKADKTLGDSSRE